MACKCQELRGPEAPRRRVVLNAQVDMNIYVNVHTHTNDLPVLHRCNLDNLHILTSSVSYPLIIYFFQKKVCILMYRAPRYSHSYINKPKAPGLSVHYFRPDHSSHNPFSFESTQS